MDKILDRMAGGGGGNAKSGSGKNSTVGEGDKKKRRSSNDASPSGRRRRSSSFKKPGTTDGFKAPSTSSSRVGSRSASMQSRRRSVTLDLKSMEQVLYGGAEKKRKLTLDDFDLLHTIGRGSFGKVMQVRKKDSGKIYALKVLKKAELAERRQIANTRAERLLLEKLSHPFLVNLAYAFQSDEKLYLVMDFVNGGEISYHLGKQGKFPEHRVRLYAAEIVLALEYCHNCNVVYRDLKPENLLLTESGHIRITDFGLSKELKKGETRSFCGTPDYLAPEVLKRQAYNHTVDWWSLGCVVFEMLTGEPPFSHNNLAIMYNRIMNQDPVFPEGFPKTAKSLVSELLQREPMARLGSKDADQIKRHPFFKGIDWDDVLEEKVKPDFVPEVKDIEDTSQFDEEFTREPPVDSITEESENHDPSCFHNFTFDGSIETSSPLRK